MKLCSFLFLASVCVQVVVPGATAEIPHIEPPAAFQITVRGQGAPMLLIPGAACSGDVWDETVVHYQSRFECHVVTLAGYAGVRPIAGPPYLETFRDALIEYARSQIGQPVVIVGHSIGGVLALWMAERAPDLVERVMVVDALPFLPALSNPAARPNLDPARAQAYELGLRSATPEQLRIRKRTIIETMVTDSERIERVLAWSLATDPRTEAWTMAELLATDLREAVGAISCPVLVLGAFTRSPFAPGFTLEAAQALYRRQYATVTKLHLHMIEARHFIMYEARDRMLGHMDAFLRPCE